MKTWIGRSIYLVQAIIDAADRQTYQTAGSNLIKELADDDNFWTRGLDADQRAEMLNVVSWLRIDLGMLPNRPRFTLASKRLERCIISGNSTAV